MLEHATSIGATVGAGGGDDGDASGITRTDPPAPSVAPNSSSDPNGNSPNTFISSTPGLDAVGDALSTQVSKLAKLQRYAVESLTRRDSFDGPAQLYADRHLDCEYDSANEAYPHQINDGQAYTVLQTWAFSVKCVLVALRHLRGRR